MISGFISWNSLQRELNRMPTQNSSSADMVCNLVTAPIGATTPTDNASRWVMHTPSEKKLNIQDPIVNEIEAIAAHQMAMTTSEKISLRLSLSTDIDDSDVSSIGEENEDIMFLCSPNRNGQQGDNFFLTPIIIDSMSSFSLTPRKEPESSLLSILNCEPLPATILLPPPLERMNKRKRQGFGS